MARLLAVAVIAALLTPWAFAQSSDAKMRIELAGSEKASKPAEVAKGYWVDGDTKLMWTMKDNGANIDWSHAEPYCKALTLGGLTGWRLPSIDELDQIYDRSKHDASEKVRGPIKLSDNWVWSGTKNGSSEAWVKDFGNGMHNHYPLDWSLDHRALCVRASEK
jgi:hypothetical protein